MYFPSPISPNYIVLKWTVNISIFQLVKLLIKRFPINCVSWRKLLLSKSQALFDFKQLLINRDLLIKNMCASHFRDLHANREIFICREQPLDKFIKAMQQGREMPPICAMRTNSSKRKRNEGGGKMLTIREIVIQHEFRQIEQWIGREIGWQGWYWLAFSFECQYDQCIRSRMVIVRETIVYQYLE